MSATMKALAIAESTNAMKWEYETVKIAATGFVGGKLDENALIARMNSLGHQGWELVTVFDTSQGGGATRDVVAIFKRPTE